MVEIIGSVPELHSLISNDINWIRDQLGNVKEDIREYTSVLYSLVLVQLSNNGNFDTAINYLIGKNKKYLHSGFYMRIVIIIKLSY